MKERSAIFLIGFMASGKTTFGKILAEKLQVKFIDLDEEVYMQNGYQNLKTLVGEKGFDFFRETESKTLRSLNTKNCVIATGGGTPCYLDNMEWMKKNGTVVFLKVSEEILFERLCKTDLSVRPLLKNLDADGLKNFIHGKLQERLPVYEQAAIIFDAEKNSVEDLVSLLCKSF